MKEEVKKKLQKRIWSLLLSTTLVFGSVDVTVFASETVEELETEIQTEQNADKDAEQETSVEQETHTEERGTDDISQSNEMQIEEWTSNITEELESIEASEKEVLDEEELFAEATSGTCGDNLTWSFDESTGTLTITGSGEMKWVQWSTYSDNITNIVFVNDSSGNGLTNIAAGAFKRCSRLTGKLNLPSSLTSIDDWAFQYCSGLEGIELPSGLTSIGRGAFQYCSGLTGKLELPSGLTSIGKWAFQYCSGLTGKLELPSGLTSIESNAFKNCSGLEGIELPSSLTSIESFAFFGCSGLTGKLELPLGLTKIDINAFDGCSGLEGIELPSSLTSIRANAFNGCSGLTGKLELPLGLTSIESAAFNGCSGLTGKLKLPPSLTRIESNVFNGCSGLEGIELPPSLTSIGYKAFNGCSGLTGYICIPETVEVIGESAFRTCSKLKRDVYIQSTDLEIIEFYNDASPWSNFCLTGSNVGTNVVTIHAPKGSTAETYANKYDYYAFEEWDGVTLPDDFYDDESAKPDNPSSEKFIINAQVPDDEFWILLRDAGGGAITPAVLSAAAGHLTVTESQFPFAPEVDYVHEEVTFKDDKGAAVTEGIIKIKNMKKVNRPGGSYKKIWVNVALPDWFVDCKTKNDFNASGGKSDYMVIEKLQRAQIGAVYVTDSREKQINMVNQCAVFYADDKKQYPLEVFTNYAEPTGYQLTMLDKNGKESVLETFTDRNKVWLDLTKISLNGSEPILFLKALRDDTELCKVKIRASSRKRPDIPYGQKITVGSGLTLTVSEFIPIFGGGEYEFDLKTDVPVHIISDVRENGDTWIQIVGSLGMDTGTLDSWLEGIQSDINKSNFREKLKEKLLEIYNPSDLDLVGHTELADMDVEVQFATYLEGVMKPGSTSIPMELRVVGEFTVEDSVTYSTVIGPVPVYVSVGGELKDEANASLSDFEIILDDDFKITKPASAEFENTLDLSIKPKAGVGVNGAISIYVEGDGTFEWKTRLSNRSKYENTVLLKLALSMGAEALCFKYNKTLAETEFQIYPGKNGKARTADIPFETAMYDASNYSVMQRDYTLEEDAAIMAYANAARSSDTNVLINGMYPDARPKCISYNGADYLFYLEDQTERAVEDKSMLVYRVNTGNGWSSAKAVDDDGTADFAYDVVAGSDGIYIAWQNAAKSLSGAGSIPAVMEQITLSAAKLSDGNSSLLDTPENEEGLAPVMISLAADNDKVWVYWITNTENDLLNNSNGKNIIYRTEAGGTEAQKLAETNHGITTLASGILNGEPCAAVTADTDGKQDTVEDREIYLVKNGKMTALTDNHVMDSNPQFGRIGQEQALVYYSENNFMRSNGTNIVPIFDTEHKNVSSDDFRLACDGSNAVIVWTEAYATAEKMGHSLAMTAYKDGSWTAPANAAQLDNTLVDFTVKAYDGGKAKLYYTELDESGSKDITRLYEAEAKQIGRAVFSGVLYDAESYVPGSALPLTVGIYNNGTCDIADCSVVIEDSKGNAVYTRGQISAPSAGKAMVMEITDFIPDNETYENYQVKLICDENVCDIRNLEVGGAEYTITYSTKYEAVTEYDRADEERLYVTISNDSNFKGDVKLVITGGESGEILYENTYEGLEPDSSANYMCSLTRLWEETPDRYIILTAQSLDREEPYLMDNSVSVFNYERMDAKVKVALDKNEAELAVGETLQLTADVQAKEGADTTLRWESRDSEYATVDQNGLVTALKPGITEITVWTVDGGRSNCYVRVLPEGNTNSSHTITYYDGTQQITMEPSAFKEDEAVLLLAPYKAGYDFAGWYETPDFSGSVAEWIPQGTTTDKVFYAKWAERVRQKDDANTETSLSIEFAGTGIYPYTGTAIKPEVIVRDEGKILQQGVDYTVSYKNNTQAATVIATMAEQGIAPYVDSSKAPMVLITGKGNYKGKKAAAMNFTIRAKELFDASVVLTCDDSMASKAAKGNYADQQLAATLKDGRKSLNKAKDYMITYDYLGENGDQTPTGADKDMTAVNKPGVYIVHISARIVKDGSGRMIRSSAKNNVSNANYTGSMEPFTLYVQDSAKILSKAKITLANTKGIQQGTDGITVEQVIKSITFGSGKTAETYGTDTADKIAVFTEKFDVTGLDTLTKKAGSGYVTVTAKAGSGYFGSKRVTVKILGTPLSKAVFTQTGNSTAFTYNGTAQAPVYTLQTSGTSPATLTEGKDYTITYQKEKTTVPSPVAAGNYTATYTGIGAYTGTVKKTFKIAPLDLAAAYKADKNAITVTASSAPYNPKGAVPAEVTVAYKPAGGTAIPLLAEDYSITYSGNKAVGKGSITLKAKGNYKGTIKNIAAYEIVAKSMASEDITVEVEDVFYKAGSDITPKVTIYDNGVKVNAKDYTVAFADRSEKLAGYKLPEGAEYADVALTVTAGAGKNYMEGSNTSAKLHIYTKKISNAEVILELNGTDNQYYYTGQQIKPALQSVTYKESKNAQGTMLANNETEGYLVRYGENMKPGSGSVIVYGTGKYGGSKTVKFMIYPKWMKWIFE